MTTSAARGPHPVPAPGACSVRWDTDPPSAYGTAARARFVVALEQDGPWGRDAARESHLDPDLGDSLARACADRGGRLLLVRRPARRGAAHRPHGRHRVLVAATGGPGSDAWLLEDDVADPASLVDLDWAALARGDEAATARSLPDPRPARPAFLVCTNGRRDVCCAVRGRPLAAAAAEIDPDAVWEVTHTGGHRFAPTALVLPWGQAYARLRGEHLAALLPATARGEMPPALLGPLHDRGRAGIDPFAQCAESAVRLATGETDLRALDPGTVAVEDSREGARDVVVRHRDGRRWSVRVERGPAGSERPESCGRTAVPVVEYRATEVTPR